MKALVRIRPFSGRCETSRSFVDRSNIYYCHHQVIIGTPEPAIPTSRVAPPLPPRGARTSLSSVSSAPVSPLHESYTLVQSPALPTRQPSLSGTPPPLLRKLSGQLTQVATRPIFWLFSICLDLGNLYSLIFRWEIERRL